MLRYFIASLVIVALLLHNIPYIVRDQAVLWLLNNGAETAQLKAINVDWFKGQVTIDQLSAQAENKPVLKADRLFVDLDYSQLSEKRILLTRVELAGINAGVREDGDSLWLGPIDLNQLGSGETEQSPSEPSDWSFGLASMALSDIDWKADVSGQQHKVKITKGSLSDFYLWDHQQPVALDLDGVINGAPLLLTSSSKPLPNEKSSDLQIKLDNFPVHSVTALFMPELRAMVDLDLKISASSDLNTKATQLKQSGSIRVRGLKLQQDTVDLNQKSLSWHGTVDLSLQGNEIGQLVSQNAINVGGIKLLSGDSQLTAEKLAIQADVKLQGLSSITVKGLNLWASDIITSQAGNGISSKDVSIKAESIRHLLQKTDTAEQFVLQGLQLQGSGLALNQGSKHLDLSGLDLSASASSPDLALWDVSVPALKLAELELNAGEEPLVSLSSAELSTAEVKHTENISISSLSARKLQVMGQDGVFSQWSEIDLSALALKELSELNVDKVQLRNSSTRVHLSEERSLSDLDWLLSKLSDQGAESSQSEALPSTQKSKPFRVKIGEINLAGENKLDLVDGGVKPAFKTSFDINKISLTGLDTGSVNKTAFVFNAKNKFSTLDAKGDIALFSGNYDGQWDLDIKGVELPQVSPYSLQYTGYYLHSGQLSLSSKGVIKDRVLDGDSDIRLNKLEVEAQNSERSGEFDQKVSMPLGTAIMVLQDNDNNIDLQIPIDGSLDDPQFGYQTVINKLAGKGLKSAAMGYLTKALQPFGTLISLGKMVADAQSKGSFISLQPVYFVPGKTELSSESVQYIEKIAQMMNERKAMRINLCGIAVAADKAPLWSKLLAENSKQKKPLPEAELMKQLEPELQQLGQIRSDNVKGLLSEKLGINIERLFSCYPKVDLDSEEKPQVSLGL